MNKPRKLTVAEVRKKFGIEVTKVVEVLQKDKTGALVITGMGEAQEIDWLRACMPTKSGLIIGVITDPPEQVPALTGRQAHEAIAQARQAATIFKDRPTVETLGTLQAALRKIERTLT